MTYKKDDYFLIASILGSSSPSFSFTINMDSSYGINSDYSSELISNQNINLNTNILSNNTKLSSISNNMSSVFTISSEYKQNYSPSIVMEDSFDLNIKNNRDNSYLVDMDESFSISSNYVPSLNISKNINSSYELSSTYKLNNDYSQTISSDYTFLPPQTVGNIYSLNGGTGSFNLESHYAVTLDVAVDIQETFSLSSQHISSLSEEGYFNSDYTFLPPQTVGTVYSLKSGESTYSLNPEYVITLNVSVNMEDQFDMSSIYELNLDEHGQFSSNYVYASNVSASFTTDINIDSKYTINSHYSLNDTFNIAMEINSSFHNGVGTPFFGELGNSEFLFSSSYACILNVSQDEIITTSFSGVYMTGFSVPLNFNFGIAYFALLNNKEAYFSLLNNKEAYF